MILGSLSRDLYRARPPRLSLAWLAGRSPRSSQASRRSHRALHTAPRDLHTTLHERFKILFLGRDEFSCVVFKALHDSQDVWESIAVATNPDTKLGQSPLRTLAESLSVPVDFIPAAKPDFKHWEPPPSFDARAPHHVLITASFGRILTPAQLALFAPPHRLNVHGSLLPAFRGPAPIQHALLTGARETGVSVVQMLARGIDKGPVWGAATAPIAPDATFTSLRRELAEQGGRLLVRVLREMLAGTAASTPQPPDSPTPHARSITAADAVLDFATMAAEHIVTLHRAIGHQRALTTTLPTGLPLQLHDPFPLPSGPLPRLSAAPGATTYSKPHAALLVRCAGGSVLAVPRVKKAMRAMIEAREFWNGVIPNARVCVGGEVRLGAVEAGVRREA
ncbi:formyl transferase [Mycena sp. CBHHK59/15]|nr:formyl transferase [Mycena sp. CBHHK59/15]